MCVRVCDCMCQCVQARAGYTVNNVLYIHAIYANIVIVAINTVFNCYLYVV